MNYLENVKTEILPPQSVATNATASVTVDTAGFGHADVKLISGLSSSNLTVLTIGFGSATNSFTNDTTFVGGTATSTAVGFVIADADTSNGVVHKFSVNLAGRERYMRLQCENTDATTVMCGVIDLYKSAGTVEGTADMGSAVDVFVGE